MSDSPHKVTSVNLDILRAIAVLSVFFSHLIRARHAESYFSLGTIGVVIFFVHTSFVLMASLQRLQTQAAGDLSLTLAFYLRRIFRIYPLAILCVLTTVVFRIPASPWAIFSPMSCKDFLSNLALTQNLTYSPYIQDPLWSLPVEVQMYLLLPFIYFVIRGTSCFRSTFMWILAVPLALISVLLAHIPPGPWMAGRISIVLFAPCFLSGVVAFEMNRGKRWNWTLPAWVWPIGILTMILLFHPSDNVSLVSKLPRAWVLSLLLGLLYANVRESKSNRIYSIFHWIAERSYGIYLSHSVVLWIVFYPMANLSLWVRIPALIAGAIGIPALLYVAFEKPLILLGGRLAKRLLLYFVTRNERQLAQA